MNNHDKLAVATATRLHRPNSFWRLWALSLFFISTSFFLTAGFAQTGLPLNFSPLSNPLPTPQSYYLDSDPNIPLGDKTPLILIHGIDLFSGPPSVSASGWDNFCIWFYNTPSLSSHFKIYRFVYQSNQASVQTLGNYFSQLLNANDGTATDQELASKDIVILAHSMGGLVSRRFLEEQRQTKAAKWNVSTLRLITLATPHHGTPVANRCDYVLNPLPDYIGALGYKFKQEIGTVDFAIAASGLSGINGIFHVIPSYNQPNRLDLLWDNYNSLFTTGFSPDEIDPPAATLNSISSAQSYDSKIVAYAGYIASGSSGHDSTLSSTVYVLANGLGIPSDGIVPIDSAWFQGRLGNSQLKFFDDYDHFQMMRSKTPPGDLPSPSDPLFTMIGSDLTKALPPVTPLTISSVSPRTFTGPTKLITITGTGFTSSSRLTFNDGVNPPYIGRVPASWTPTQLTYDVAVGSNPTTWTVKVVNGAVESLPYSFYVVSGTAQLTSLGVSGPAAIAENNGGQFTATAYFSDGSQQNVSSSASWSENSSATTISSSGFLNAGSVSSDTAATVSASYTTGGITKSASANVTIVNSGSCGSTISEKILNGNFANNGNNWSLTGNFFANANFSVCYSCPGYAWFANADGTGGNNLSGTLSQSITIPANATSVTLGYYYRITTAETGGTAFDFLTLNLVLPGGTLVGLDQRSNLHANGSYAYRSFDITAYKGQTITVRFTATTDGSLPTVFRVDDVSVIQSVPNPVTPVLFGVGGPTNVAEGSTAQYNAIVVNCDGSIQSVTPTWSENSSATTISSSGLLTVGSVSSDTPVTITATYSGFPSLNYPITVVNSVASFSYLAISGPSSINENTSGQFTASAIFSDGSSQSVSPSWAENSSATTISSGGLLNAGEVGSDTTVTVSASHTIGGVTCNANQDVLIVNIPPPVTLSSLSISGPNSVNENSTAQYSATALFSDGSSQSVNPTWSEDSAATSVSIFGLLSAGEVASDMAMTVSASYTFNAVTRNASTNVMVKDVVQPTALFVGFGGNQIVLSWSTNSAGFVLEYATNLPPTGWLTNSTTPVIVNGRYTVTNAVTGGGMFYRLKK